MQERITEKQLRRFYRLLSSPVTTFNCGRLCGTMNGGIPACCDENHIIPVLYSCEYRWLRKRDRFWRKFRPQTKHERQEAEALEDWYVLAACPGPAQCRRSLRSISCRCFPFEPYVDTKGNLLGLTFQYRNADLCPLIGKPKKTFNPTFIKNSLIFWEELLEIFPGERDEYRKESNKLRRTFKKKNRRIQVFR